MKLDAVICDRFSLIKELSKKNHTAGNSPGRFPEVSSRFLDNVIDGPRGNYYYGICCMYLSIGIKEKNV